MRSRRLMSRAVIVVLALLVDVSPTLSQDEFNCSDFATQFEAQQVLTSTYPEDPNRLDRDRDWIACEVEFNLTPEEEARIVPADMVNRGTPDPTPPPSPEPESPVAVPPSGGSPRIDPPADLMEQVADCEVVAVSSRSIAAAGCPGVGVIVLRPPAGTPRMRSMVIIRPGAAFADTGSRSESAAQRAEPDKPGKSRKEKRRPRRSRERASSEVTAPQATHP